MSSLGWSVSQLLYRATMPDLALHITCTCRNGISEIAGHAHTCPRDRTPTRKCPHAQRASLICPWFHLQNLLTNEYIYDIIHNMEEKSTDNDSKSPLLKTLFIVGFLVAVLLLAWLSTQLVRVVPSTIATLATLAEQVSQSQTTLSGDPSRTSLSTTTEDLPLTPNDEAVLVNQSTSTSSTEPDISDQTTDTPPAPTTPITPPSEPTYTFTWEIPESNPNGTIDLVATYLGAGEIISGEFVAGPVSTQNPGAIQFSVHNIGSKLSGEWAFTTTLPDGSIYTSPAQTALKPNERSTLTVGFPTSSKTTHTFVVAATTDQDAKASNNSFRQTITFVN